MATHQTADTIIIEKTDTIKDTCFIVKTEKVTDTIFIETDKGDNVMLPITQKHYSDNKNYGLWISGYNACLDSIILYNKEQRKVVTNTITNNVHVKRNELYFFGGFNAHRDGLAPKLGISLKTKKEWLITTEIGLNKYNAFYGVSIGKKINF